MNIRLAALGQLLNRQAVNFLVIEEAVPSAIASRAISVETAQRLKAAVDAACVAYYLVERDVIASAPPDTEPPCGCAVCRRAFSVLALANDPIVASLPIPMTEAEYDAYQRKREEEERQAVSILASKLPPGLADALLGKYRAY